MDVCKDARKDDQDSLEMASNLEDVRSRDSSILLGAVARGRRKVSADYLSQNEDASITSAQAGQTSQDWITTLPSVVTFKLFMFLKPTDLLNIAQTCHVLRYLSEDNLLWNKKCNEENLPYCLNSMDEKLLGYRNTLNSSLKQSIQHLERKVSSFKFSHWKASFLKQNRIKMNILENPIKKPVVLDLSDVRPETRIRPVNTCMEFVGNKVITVCGNTMKIWYPLSGICLGTLAGHLDTVSTIQVDNNFVISGSLDTSIKVWNTESGECVRTLRGHTQEVLCSNLHGAILVTGSYDRTVRLWNVWEGTSISVYNGHQTAVRSVQFNGSRVASGSDDGAVKIWNTQGECLNTFHSHRGQILSVKFAAGIHLFSSSKDGSIRVWDVEAGTCRFKLKDYVPIEYCGYFGDVTQFHDEILVSGHKNSTAKIWDTVTWNCLQMLDDDNKHSGAINAIDFSEKYVVTGSMDGKVKIWDIKTGNFIRDLIVLEEGQVKMIRMNYPMIGCVIIRENGSQMNGPAEILLFNFDY